MLPVLSKVESSCRVANVSLASIMADAGFVDDWETAIILFLVDLKKKIKHLTYFVKIPNYSSFIPRTVSIKSVCNFILPFLCNHLIAYFDF